MPKKRDHKMLFALKGFAWQWRTDTTSEPDNWVQRRRKSITTYELLCCMACILLPLIIITIYENSSPKQKAFFWYYYFINGCEPMWTNVNVVLNSIWTKNYKSKLKMWKNVSYILKYSSKLDFSMFHLISLLFSFLFSFLLIFFSFFVGHI